MRREIRAIFQAIRDNAPRCNYGDIVDQAAFNLGEMPCLEFDMLCARVVGRLIQRGIIKQSGQEIRIYV